MFDDKIRIREMNKVIFHNNLMSTIHEILGSDNLKEDDIRFKIIPVYERDKSFNAVDDLMRLVILSDSNIGGKLLTVKETVSVVACQEPLVPIWINISYYGKKEDKLIFNFETSLRFRKPSLLRNADTGHPPFKAGIKDMIKNDRVSLWLGYFETPEEFSCDSEIIPQFERLMGNEEICKYNSILLLYNFEYEQKHSNKDKRMNYIGCVDARKKFEHICKIEGQS